MQFVKPILATLLCAAPIPAFAASLFVNTNFSQSTGPGQTYSYRSPTYPLSYIGVNFEAGYNAIEATASFTGRARFDMPTVTGGTFTPYGSSVGRMDFSHAFTSTELTGGVNFSGGINYHIGYGPLSADGRILQVDLPVTIAQGMSGGSAIGGSAALQSATATGPFAGYRFVAEQDLLFDTIKVGEAALGVTPGLKASNTVNWQGNFTYGYYSWTNTTGGLGMGDTVVWRAAAPGTAFADLILGDFSGDGYYNVLPGVLMDGFLRQEQRLDFTLSGRAFLEALGTTLINENFNATVPLFKDGQGFDSIGNKWLSRNVWSTRLFNCGIFDENAPVINPNIRGCEMGGSLLDIEFGQGGLGDEGGNVFELADRPGGFLPVPGFTDRPRPGPVCKEGKCYEVDGFDFPVTRIVLVSGAVPEPATWAMMILGFGLVGSAARRRGPKAVPA